MFLSNSRVCNSCARAHLAQVEAFTYNSAKEKYVNKLIKTNFEIAKAKVKKNAIDRAEHITIETLTAKKHTYVKSLLCR